MYLCGANVDDICESYSITVEQLKGIVTIKDKRLKRAVDLFNLHKAITISFNRLRALELSKHLYNRRISSLSALRDGLDSGKFKKSRCLNDIIYLVDRRNMYYNDTANDITAQFVKFFADASAYDCLDFLVSNKYVSLQTVRRDLYDIVNNPARYKDWNKQVIDKLKQLFDYRETNSYLESYNYSLLKLLSHLIFNSWLDDYNITVVKQVYDLLIPYDKQPSMTKNYTISEVKSLLVNYINGNMSTFKSNKNTRNSLTFILTLLYGKHVVDKVLELITDNKAVINAKLVDGEIILMYKDSIPIQKLIS